MNKQDMVWLLVRTTGFWMLALSLQTLPSLLIALPEITNMILLWNTSLTHGPTAKSVGILSKLTVYLVAAFYLIGRGEGLIAWMNKQA